MTTREIAVAVVNSPSSTRGNRGFNDNLWRVVFGKINKLFMGTMLHDGTHKTDDLHDKRFRGNRYSQHETLSLSKECEFAD